jgi:hypothetical protein
MRHTYAWVLPLLLALSQLAVSSSYSTQAAQQQQEQQQNQCWQPVRSSYAAEFQSELDNGSCPAQLVPLAAEAPASAGVATVAGATNNTQHSRGQLLDSRSSSGSGGSQDAEQACKGKADCSWQTFIVRFSEYKMLAEHKQALQKVGTATLATSAYNWLRCVVRQASSTFTYAAVVQRQRMLMVQETSTYGTILGTILMHRHASTPVLRFRSSTCQEFCRCRV